MKIFIMRHGEASQYGSSDAQRALTESGEAEVAVMSKWLVKQCSNFDQIIISPYERAQQTANIVTKVINTSDMNIEYQTTTDIITPLGDAKVVHDYIDGLLENGRIKTLLFVSHMPLVSYLVEELTVDGAMPIFQTAGISEIDYNAELMKGHLLRQVSPYDLR
jgi:phosphohistidine phosphatase